jgi:hypothetical protein
MADFARAFTPPRAAGFAGGAIPPPADFAAALAFASPLPDFTTRLGTPSVDGSFPLSAAPTPSVDEALGFGTPPPRAISAVADSLLHVDFASMPLPTDSWHAVEQLEAALEMVRRSVETQLEDIELDTERLESMYDQLVDQVAEVEESAPETAETEMKSLLVCYFPREANKEMIRNAFAPFGTIDSVYLVHKDGKPACYGFVNFAEHSTAKMALEAAQAEQVQLIDKRNVIWRVKAEWTQTNEIPKKPKKKRTKKDTPGGAKSLDFDQSGATTPPMDLSASLTGHPYHPSLSPPPMSATSPQFRYMKPLSYSVAS